MNRLIRRDIERALKITRKPIVRCLLASAKGKPFEANEEQMWFRRIVRVFSKHMPREQSKHAARRWLREHRQITQSQRRAA